MGCKKFTPYIQGKTIILETDHKPLVPLLSHKGLDSLPPRILRFCLRLMRYDYEIKHVSGKLLHTADALSRAPLKDTINPNEMCETKEIEFHMSSVISTLPVSDSNLTTFSQEQAEESVCCKLILFCRIGWPNKSSLPSCMNPTGSFEETSHYMAIFFCIKTRLPSCKNKFYISFIRATRAYSVAAFEPNHPCGG